MHSRYVTVIDQIASSLSNFLLVALVARSSTPTEFGQFSLAYVVLIFFLGFQRSLVGEVLLVRFSVDAIDRTGYRHAAGLASVVGVVGLVVIAGWSFFAPGGSGVLWLCLGVIVPVVLVQDVVRYVLISRGLSGFALLIDTIWVVLSATAMVVLVSVRAGAVPVILSWGAGALLSLAIGLAISRAWPRPVGGVRWLIANRDIAVRFSAEYASLNLSTALVWFALAVPVGSIGVAGLRGAALLFSPLNTAFNSVRIAMIPELVRSRGDARRYRRRLVETGTVLAVLAVLWGGTVLILPDSVGRLVLGQTWEIASDLRWPNFLQVVAMVGYTVLLAMYRSTSRHRQSSVMRGVLAAATLITPVLLAVLVGVTGAAWGFAIAVTLAVLIGAGVTTITARRRPAESAAQPAEVIHGD